MTLEIVRSILAWCLVFDLLILFLWFGWFVFGRDFIYRMHSKWFPMSVDHFNRIHYAGIAIFKICIIVFHLGPYLALRIVG